MSASSSFEQQLRNIEGKTNDELLDIIGAFALSQYPEELRASLAADSLLDSARIRNAAERFLAEIAPIIEEAICGPDGLAHYMEQPTVKDILTVLLPDLGISIGGVVPTALVALGVTIARAGVRRYSRDLESRSI